MVKENNRDDGDVKLFQKKSVSHRCWKWTIDIASLWKLTIAEVDYAHFCLNESGGDFAAHFRNSFS